MDLQPTLDEFLNECGFKEDSQFYRRFMGDVYLFQMTHIAFNLYRELLKHDPTATQPRNLGPDSIINPASRIR